MLLGEIKKISLLFISLFAILLLQAQTFDNINYQQSLENFPNPGRGFYHAVNNIDYENLLEYRSEEGISLIFKTFKLDSYKEGSIDVIFLKNMENDFAVLRKAGMKCIIRFSYTEKSTPPYGDAPLDIVVGHIEQLKPILRNNSDVILAFQAGFIGAWGEWYYTDYFAVSPGHLTEENWNDRRTLVDSLLSAVPEDIMVQVRTPYYKYHLLEFDEYMPVTEDLAYSSDPIARIAHHNDCFVAGNNDYGTYIDTLVEKPYLEQDTKYTMIGGETCNECAQSHCENTVAELKRFHWTYLNIDYHTGVIGDWIEEGCFDDIQIKLGYRYRLVSMHVQNETKPGGKFNFEIKLFNDGWANPAIKYNVNIILVDETSGNEWVYKTDFAPRYWPLHDTISLNLNTGVSSNMPLGSYSLQLSFTEENEDFKNRPEYMIRLANPDCWENETGQNKLSHSLIVDENSTASTYSGRNLFVKDNQVVSSNEIIIDGNDSDWQNIDVTYLSSEENASSYKFFNDKDNLYFLIKGNNYNDVYSLFLDADNNTQTGFNISTWASNGSDYLIESGSLFYYTGEDDNKWFKIGDIPSVVSDSIIEFSVPIEKLSVNVELSSYGFTTAFEKQQEGTTEMALIPLSGEEFIFNKLYKIFSEPLALQVQNYGENNLIYWPKPYSKSVYSILERAGDNGEFQEIVVQKADNICFIDKNLEVSKNYSYRIKYSYSGTESTYSDIKSLIVEGIEPYYASIVLDGDLSDWNVIPPVAANILDDTLSSIHFFNTSDSIYLSIKTANIETVSLRLDTDIDGVFDYLISSDSLFSYANGDIEFIKKIAVFINQGFYETGFLLSDISFEENDMLAADLFLNQQQLWWPETVFNFMKFAVLTSPNNFDVVQSINNPFTRLKIKWKLNTKPDAYVIERSVGDSLNFEKLIEMSSSSMYYLDSELDSSLTYYYRMYSYQDISRSSYTKVLWAQPGHPDFIENHELQTVEMTVSPNPIRDLAFVRFNTPSSNKAKIELYNLQGHLLKTVFQGIIDESKVVEFSRGNLSSGVYLLVLKTDNSVSTTKIILY